MRELVALEELIEDHELTATEIIIDSLGFCLALGPEGSLQRCLNEVCAEAEMLPDALEKADLPVGDNLICDNDAQQRVKEQVSIDESLRKDDPAGGPQAHTPERLNSLLRTESEAIGPELKGREFLFLD